MLGNAAVVIWCDVAAGMREEFDDWHAHEHLPERLSIPGFLRGSRWVSVDGNNSYFMLYEAATLETVSCGAYLDRLNDPTPWSRKMMPHHRNMTRSLCNIQASHGAGLAAAMLTVRFSPVSGTSLEAWLSGELLPALPAKRGFVSARFLKAASGTPKERTTEQKIRGGDATADWVVLVNGYSADALAALAGAELGEASLASRGAAPGSVSRVYGLAASLTAAAVV